MNIAQAILIAALHAYRWTLSPVKQALFGPAARCRFTPSCSAYAIEAIRKHGAFWGVGLTARRLLRCHPFGGCGYDPVPAQTPHFKWFGSESPHGRHALRNLFGLKG